MQQPVNPFFQHAVQQGQMALSEVAKAMSVSQYMIPACDDIIQSINSGNIQRAAIVAQNLRGMSEQINHSVQFLNNSINQRMDMMQSVLSRAQQNISELTGAIQSIRNTQMGFTGVQHYQAAPLYMA